MSTKQTRTHTKHPYFAQQFIAHLISNNIQPKPALVAAAFNKHYQTTVAKPHTVRKWLIGETQPKSETLLLLANWLKVDPKDLISVPNEPVNITNKVSFEVEIKETLEKLNDSIIELNEDDLRNLILSVATCSSPLNQLGEEKIKLITRQEMANELKISLPTLRKWTKKKIIPNHIKLGGFVFYNRQQVIDFIKSKKENR